ncbi:MAG: hypothetical protein IPO65_16475 [Saprospiraceae bacterium]|nr:hypothetical protein [Saprospiraceae bacterium]
MTDGQVIAYTITVTDGAGNTATCSVNVTYEDDDNPVAVCPSSNVTITLGSPSGTYTLSQPEIDALGTGSTDNCVIASYSINDGFFDCADSGFEYWEINIVTREY